MPRFRYTAKNLQGDRIESFVEAVDRRAVTALIRQKDFFPVQIQALDSPSSHRDIELRVRIPGKALAVFCNQAAAVLHAGVPIVQALEIMRSQTEHKQLKKVLMDVQEKIQQGRSLSAAFRDHEKRFPELFLSMVESGEASGTLEAALAQVGLTLTKEYKIVNRVKSALAYPTALLVLAVGVVLFLMTVIVPRFADLYATSNAALPKLTQVMLSISNFLTTNVVAVVIALIALVTGVVVFARSTPGRRFNARLTLRLPLIGKQIVKVFSARFTRSLAGLSIAGVSITNALSIAGRNVGNLFISEKMEQVVNEVSKGRGIAASLQEIDIFPMMVIHMVRMGEESGTLDDMLRQAAEFYEEESDSAMARILAILEPVIIALMGVLVLVIVLSVVLPMFGIYNAVSF
ncbi:MAG: type II secretion system F family protein [Eubacteriales bacterium]|nr:type II secretion system F family protein [Eubacteriales bacterium]